MIGISEKMLPEPLARRTQERRLFRSFPDFQNPSLNSRLLKYTISHATLGSEGWLLTPC